MSSPFSEDAVRPPRRRDPGGRAAASPGVGAPAPTSDAATLSAPAALTGRGLLADEVATARAQGFAFRRGLEARRHLLPDRPADAQGGASAAVAGRDGAADVLPPKPEGFVESARGLGYAGADAAFHRSGVRWTYRKIFEGVAP